MPSDGLIRHFGDILSVAGSWRWSGLHYARTAEDWLCNLDRHRNLVLPILRSTYGVDAERWLQRWRLFFLAVAELFAFGGGAEWGVMHYRLQKSG